MKKIIISGWYGFKNTGDEAILASMINTIHKEINNVDITVFSSDPTYTTKIHHIKAVYQLPFTLRALGSTILKRRLFQTIKALWKVDLFILGGGGFLSDWQSWKVILQWLGQVVLAKMFRKKVMLYAVGAGSITTKKGKFLTRIILNRYTDVITVRDDKSKVWLQKAGVKKKIHVTADPAILLEPEKPDRIFEILMKEGINVSKPLIGILICPIFHIQKYWPNQQKKFQKFKEIWPKIIEFITSKLDSNVILIPMQIPTDRDFVFELIKNVKNKNKVKVIMGNYTPKEIMGIIGQMDMIVGMRFHSLVLAAGMGVPMIGIIYLHKSDCLLKEIGQEKFSIDIGDGVLWKNKDIDLEKLVINVEQVWSKREIFKKEIMKKVGKLQNVALINVKFVQALLSKG